MMDEIELQDRIQRFATQITELVTQATEALERSATDPAVADEALRKNVRYVSSALEIAAGPSAEVNLLDMVVFVRLSRAVLERHWIPELYGEDGRELAGVFARFEVELDELARAVLKPEQLSQLAVFVDEWLAANPEQRRVEGIRLADFAGMAGARAGQARGLLSSVKTAARTANQAMLLGERVLFLVQRLPFVWRLQARLTAREVMKDLLARPLHFWHRWRKAIAAGAGALALGGMGLAVRRRLRA
jgi:hypothetical protein